MDLHKIRLCGTFTTLRKVHAELESLRLKKSATILLSCYLCPGARRQGMAVSALYYLEKFTANANAKLGRM